ncbi:MAG TPA: peptidylprolyl isomerase [Candidatus Baltobacteraceae bacterium]|jgi:peptidyl-prolyl cis-trans isomerase C|nr:peptidylprolyl isomerase [Candidatus Baltobacteraceae bacterium]
MTMIQKIFRTLGVAALALTLVQLPFAARAVSADTSTNLFADPVVATGKGFEIKLSQVDDSFLNYSAAEAARGGSIPDADRASVRAKLLDHLIIDHILLQMATPDERTETQKKVDAAINEARTNSPAAFDAQVKATGLTLDQMRNRAVEQQLCRQVLIRETTNGITVSDAEVKKFYDDNPSDFEMPERAHVAHILISTLDPLTQSPLPPDQKKEKEKLAGEIRSRAENGEDFAKLVKQYSDDPGSKDKGGEYTFARNHQMVPEFEAAAFSLKTNQISDLVETRYGYHIIKLIEMLPPSKEPFAEASTKIHDYLVAQQANKGLDVYLAKLKANADVKILDQSLVDVSADKATTPAK